MDNREIEMRFLEIDAKALEVKLRNLGAKDLGVVRLQDSIFYDRAGKWLETGRTFVRLRQKNQESTLTYKHEESETATGVEEIEFQVSNPQKTKQFLEAVGLFLTREQEKIRHSFRLDQVMIDIDTWPKIPTYVEIEGPTEESIMGAAAKLGFPKDQAVFGTAMTTIEKYYHIPIKRLRYFTFAKIA